MGTAKRERQKANRQLRLQQLHKQARRTKTKRFGLRFVIGVPVAIAGIFGLAWLTSRGDETSSSATTTIDPFAETSTTVDPLATTTTVDPAAPTTTTEVPATTTTWAPPVTVHGNSIHGTTTCPDLDGSFARTISFDNAPEMCIDEESTYTALVKTNKGDLTIELDPAASPVAANNFVVLALYHFFDNTECHRAIKEFMVQCGDPTATGSGGPGYQFDDELPEAGSYKLGSVVMANSGPNTNGSQFFLISGEDGIALGPDYVLFGQITVGLDTTLAALNEAARPSDDGQDGQPPLEQLIIESVTITKG